MNLILILTYQCNYRCRYCGIRKRDERMSESVVSATIRFLEQTKNKFSRVKFFGGEPLLEKTHLKTILETFPRSAGIPDFYVTTNAVLIDDDFMKFAREKNLHVTVSMDGDAMTTDANRKTKDGDGRATEVLEILRKNVDNVRVNQVVGSENAGNFFENFRFLYEQGVRKFNFLPEYFRLWTRPGLVALAEGFGKILRFYKAGNHFECINLENKSEIPFFNLGLVVDTDGKLYGTNLILESIFEDTKPRLCIGSVFTGLISDIGSVDFIREYTQKVRNEITTVYSQKILASMRYADDILNAFVVSFSESLLCATSK